MRAHPQPNHTHFRVGLKGLYLVRKLVHSLACTGSSDPRRGQSPCVIHDIPSCRADRCMDLFADMLPSHWGKSRFHQHPQYLLTCQGLRGRLLMKACSASGQECTLPSRASLRPTYTLVGVPTSRLPCVPSMPIGRARQERHLCCTSPTARLALPPRKSRHHKEEVGEHPTESHRFHVTCLFATRVHQWVGHVAAVGS